MLDNLLHFFFYLVLHYYYELIFKSYSWYYGDRNLEYAASKIPLFTIKITFFKNVYLIKTKQQK